MRRNATMVRLDDLSLAFHVGDRTLSAALLAWFLSYVWELDDGEVEEAVCDSPLDRGIDGIWVDSDADEIYFFQAYRAEAATKTQGSAKLAEFVGAVENCNTPEGLRTLLAQSQVSAEFRATVARQGVVDALAVEGATVHMVFVTNVELDSNGQEYVDAHNRSGARASLRVYGGAELTAYVDRTKTPGLIGGQVVLPTVGPALQLDLERHGKLAIALVAASDLVELPGIEDQSLFSRNVRLSIGPTPVNRELAKTIRDPLEHALFPAFHNGLTALTNRLAVGDRNLTLDHVGVVNGCQSLKSLHDMQEYLTPEMNVVVKVIEVGDDESLSEKITHRSNNQNSVNLRDQKANTRRSRDIQDRVNSALGQRYFLRVKRGEVALPNRIVIDNIDVAQDVMAIYLQEPWNAVRKLRNFGSDFARVFSRTLTPEQVVFANVIREVVFAGREGLPDDIQKSFASVRFAVEYVVSSVLRKSQAGRDLLASPGAHLDGGAREEELRRVLGDLAKLVFRAVGSHFSKNKSVEGFDRKVVYKGQKGVTDLENDVSALVDLLADSGKDYIYRS